MNVLLTSFLLCMITMPGRLSASPLPQKYQVKRFNDENGLPQNSVNGMGVDDAGFVWIATHGGLVRFDGRKLTTYTKQMLSMESDRFIRMKLDALTGILYAVNGSGNVIALKAGKPVILPTYPTEKSIDLESIAPSRTRKMHIDTIPTADEYSQYNVIAGTPGNYYVYADQKILFFRNGKVFSVLNFPGIPYLKPFPGEPSIRRKDIAKTKGLICIDNFISVNGKLFYHIGSEGTRFSLLMPTGVQATSLIGDITQHPDFTREKQTIRIVTNRLRGQAFAILGDAIYHVTYSERDKNLHSTLLTDDFNIDENMVSRLLYDEKNRTLFLGSFSQGLLTIRPKAFQVITNPEEENFHNVYYTQLPFSPSSVLIQTGAILGDYHAAPQDGIAFRKGAPTGRSSMLRDRKGRCWIFKSSSLLRLTANASKVEAAWDLGPRIPERMYHTPDGYIWIGFRDGEIMQLKSDAGTLEKPATVVKLNDASSFFYEDRPGYLWLGTTRGLFLFDRRKKTVSPVKGLSGKNIRTIYRTTPDELWITTYGDGLFLITGNKLIRLPLDKNGHLRHAHDILEDENENFWIPSNKGLFRISRQDLLACASGKLSQPFYMYYNKEDGFLTNEFNGGCQPCGVKLRDGHYSMPSMNGLVWFKPAQIPAPYLEAPLFFENMQIDDKPTVCRDSIRLKHDFGHISFEIATSFTGVADNLEMYYSIQGGDSENTGWTRINKDQRVDIYRLKPGKYKVVVRKITGFGGKKIERQLFLMIASPWFLSWWFICLTLVGISGLVWLFVQWRLRNLTRQNALLSEKVEERTSHLTKALDDLKVSDDALQTQLQIQMRIIGIINHDLHSPLKYLSNQLPRLLEQVKPCMTNHDTAHLASAISKSTLKVYQLADDLLRFIKATYNKKGQITYQDVPLKEVLEQKAAFFTEIARENQTTLTVNCEPELVARTNFLMTEILIHNLLDNALKHTYSQSVTLAAQRVSTREVDVVVSDTGYGMYPEIVDWLNDNSPQNNGNGKSSQTPTNLGLGLIMVKEISMLLGIDIRTESNAAGTVIRLRFTQ